MFLTKTEITKQARKEIDIEQLDSLCGKCGLFKDCKTKRMEVSGTGKKEILIIGDTPSSSDDQNAIQFVHAGPAVSVVCLAPVARCPGNCA